MSEARLPRGRRGRSARTRAPSTPAAMVPGIQPSAGSSDTYSAQGPLGGPLPHDRGAQRRQVRPHRHRVPGRGALRDDLDVAVPEEHLHRCRVHERRGSRAGRRSPGPPPRRSPPRESRGGSRPGPRGCASRARASACASRSSDTSRRIMTTLAMAPAGPRARASTLTCLRRLGPSAAGPGDLAEPSGAALDRGANFVDCRRGDGAGHDRDQRPAVELRERRAHLRFEGWVRIDDAPGGAP